MFSRYYSIQSVIDRIALWMADNFWSPDTFFQIVVIFGSFVLSAFGYQVFRKRLNDSIDNSPLPIRVKRTANHLQKLLVPLFTLIFMFLFTQILGSPVIGMDVTVTIVAMKLLLAWLVIRIALQFVDNPILRNIFAFAIWLVAALSIFEILDETTATLDAIGFSIGKFRLSALSVIKGLFSIFLLLYLAVFASTFLERQVLRSPNLTRSSQVLIAKIIRVSLVVFALLIGVTSAGIDLSIFTVFSGAVGLGIGFGLQKVASNLFSGFLLLMDRSIKPGDVIELESSGTFGWVNHMAARYIEIVTRDNKSYLIPNEDFITQRVVNWSHGDKLIRLQVSFGAHYDCNPHHVIKVAIEAAKNPARVVEQPAPVCWITEFGDNSINYSLRFWIKDAEGGVSNVKGQVLLALWDAFQENNIQIPYPHREVYIHQAPPAASRKE